MHLTKHFCTLNTFDNYALALCAENITFYEQGAYLYQLIEQINFDSRYKRLVDVNKIKICFDKIRKLEIVSCEKELPFLSYLPYNFIFKDSNYQDKILIQGVADLVVKSKDRIILIDYKTTKVAKPDLLVEKYKVQLMLYKICLEKALNIKIDQVFIYSFLFDRLIEIV